MVAGFLEDFYKFPPILLPARCDFIVNDFNRRLQSNLDLKAPLKAKRSHSKPAVPWRNDNLKKLKRNCREKMEEQFN